MLAGRRAFIVWGLTIGTAAGLLTATTPAQAKATCTKGYVCMWEDSNYDANRWVKSAKPANGKTRFVNINGWNGDNEISSVINNTGCSLMMYEDDSDHRGGKYGYKAVATSTARIPDMKVYNFSIRASRYEWETTSDGANDDVESFVIDCT